MSKISIIEVFDPFINEFISVDEAILRRIFNEENYEYNDYVNNKKFSVTDAVQRGFYRTKRYDEEVDEELLVTQTFEILKVVDPFDKNIKLDYEEAIKRGIIDLNKNVYHDLNKKKDFSFNEAIQKKLIQVNLINELHEKLRDKVTVKSEDSKNVNSNKNSNEKNLVPIVKNQDKVILPNALVKNLDDNCFMDIDEAVKTGIFNKSTALYYDVHLNDAIESGNIILPNGEYLVKHIESAKDVETSEDLEIKLALKRGIIDSKKKLFLDTKTNQKISLYEALFRGFLILRCNESIINKVTKKNSSVVEISNLKKNFNLITSENSKSIMSSSPLNKIVENEEITNNDPENKIKIDEEEGFLSDQIEKTDDKEKDKNLSIVISLSQFNKKT
jgi:hypothetical protein